VTLYGNLITHINSGTFGHLKSLQKLDLTDNKITSISSTAFFNVGTLRVLKLSQNQLTTLPDKTFQKLSSLTELELHENLLSSLRPKVFDELHALQNLTLNDNLLKSLPNFVFYKLTALSQLYLQNNELKDVSRDLFDGLKRMRYLSLGFQKMGGWTVQDEEMPTIDIRHKVETELNSTRTCERLRNVLPLLAYCYCAKKCIKVCHTILRINNHGFYSNAQGFSCDRIYCSAGHNCLN